ncbi:hypothetical protein ROHU_025975 [Labeo rohita]|uniref:Uncharacterized protein n=1 Tax=Labeo rohita TaxID=84645 RepID=A0A498LK51_LABRO|nr:hypothetical protein ROHU_032093 [Labeo rohita]RXN18835.1 hypothetical protein ROHU_025975 [Labeo rohita]
MQLPRGSAETRAEAMSRRRARGGLLMTSRADIISADGRGPLEGVRPARNDRNRIKKHESYIKRAEDFIQMRTVSRGFSDSPLTSRFRTGTVKAQPQIRSRLNLKRPFKRTPEEISIRQTEELHLSSIHRKGHEFERNGAFRAHIYPSFVAACSEPVSFLLKSDQSRSVSTPSLRRPERSVLFACDGQRCRSYITAEKRSDWSRSGWTHPCQCVRRKIMTSSA